MPLPQKTYCCSRRTLDERCKDSSQRVPHSHNNVFQNAYASATHDTGRSGSIARKITGVVGRAWGTVNHPIPAAVMAIPRHPQPPLVRGALVRGGS